MRTNTTALLALIILIFISSCKDDTPKPEQNLNGKIAPSLSMTRDGDIEFYDIRDAENPKKAAFNIIGNTDNFYLQYIKSRPIGTKTIATDYGDLSINHNEEMYLADKNWSNWKSISVVREWLVMNNDNTTQLYPSYQDYEDSTKLYDYEDFFEDYKTIGNWGNAGTINGCAEVYERYNSPYNTRNAFYFNFKTQEYLFQKDINSSTSPAISGYKITDLVKKPNGNMDTDPIDWTKADFAFVLSYNHTMTKFTYNGKTVNIFVFVDMDTKTYAAFTRNAEDDATNGANNSRQNLITTSWQPLSNLIKGWNL